MAKSAYEIYLDEQRAAAGLQGASTGASVGAGIGTAILPGIGTAIGGGIGALGGGIIGAASYSEDPSAKARLQELEELLRRQDIGALGLTTEERAALEAELIDPMRAARREQQLKFQQATSGQNIGAGSYFKMAQGEEQRMATQESPVRAKIESINQEQIKQDLARIDQLQKEQIANTEAAREANLQSIESIAGIADEFQKQMALRAENDLFAERETELLDTVTNGTPEESQQAQQALSFLQSFYR